MPGKKRGSTASSELPAQPQVVVDEAVVHEQPAAVAERMAVGLLDRRPGRRADVGEEQRRLDLGGELAQVAVAPRGRDAAVEARARRARRTSRGRSRRRWGGRRRAGRGGSARRASCPCRRAATPGGSDSRSRRPSGTCGPPYRPASGLETNRSRPSARDRKRAASWPRTLLPAASSGGANVPSPPLPGRDGDDAAADAALAGQADVVEPVARGLVQDRRWPSRRARSGRPSASTTRSPVTGFTPPSASVAPITARSCALTRASTGGCRGRSPRADRRTSARSCASRRAMLWLRSLVADADA